MLAINNIYNMDYFSGIQQIDNKSIDLLLTDPPYLYAKGGMKSKQFNVGCRSSNSFVVKKMSDFGEEKINLFLDLVKPKMKQVNMYVFSSKLQVPYYLNWAIKNKCQFDILMWDKDFKGIINRKFFASNSEYIIRIYKKGLNQLDDINLYQKIHKFKRVKNKLHEAEKPIELLKRFILLSSNEGDLIFDAFTGSGTTAIACIDTNRNYIGFEIDKNYYDIAINRIKELENNGIGEKDARNKPNI